MEYAVVTSTQLDDLTQEVGTMMKKGWLPQGVIAIGRRPERDGRKHYMQAMTKGMKF